MKYKYLKNVVTLQLKDETCIGCGMCTEVCPRRVFRLEANKAQITNKDACMECGACMNNCPVEAIFVKPGVGCAYAIIRGIITGSEPECGCGGGDCCS